MSKVKDNRKKLFLKYFDYHSLYTSSNEIKIEIELFHQHDFERFDNDPFSKTFWKEKIVTKYFQREIILEPLHKFNRVCGWARRFSSRLNGPFVFKVRVFSSIAISLSLLEFLFKDHLPHIGASASGLNLLFQKASKGIVNNTFKGTQ